MDGAAGADANVGLEPVHVTLTPVPGCAAHALQPASFRARAVTQYVVEPDDGRLVIKHWYRSPCAGSEFSGPDAPHGLVSAEPGFPSCVGSNAGGGVGVPVAGTVEQVCVGAGELGLVLLACTPASYWLTMAPLVFVPSTPLKVTKIARPVPVLVRNPCPPTAVGDFGGPASSVNSSSLGAYGSPELAMLTGSEQGG